MLSIFLHLHSFTTTDASFRHLGLGAGAWQNLTILSIMYIYQISIEKASAIIPRALTMIEHPSMCTVLMYVAVGDGSDETCLASFKKGV